MAIVSSFQAGIFRAIFCLLSVRWFLWSSGDLVFQSFDEVAIGYSSQCHGPDLLLQGLQPFLRCATRFGEFYRVQVNLGHLPGIPPGPAAGEQDVPDCHLRFSKRLRFVLPVPGISLRDDKAGADKLRLLPVHLRPGSLRQSLIFFADHN